MPDAEEARQRAVKSGILFVIVVALIAGGYWRLRTGQAPVPPQSGADGPARSTWQPQTFRREGIMGTYAQVTLHATDARQEVADEVFAVFTDLEQRFSTWQQDSEASALNRQAADEPFACSPQMWTVLMASKRAWAESEGGFDITAGPLMRLWGFHRQRDTTPTETEIAEALAKVGFAKLAFAEAERTVQFTVPGMTLDFGGVVKGYAVDLAAARLRDQGIHQGMIDLGGNIFCLEEPPTGRDTYRIGIRNPRNPRDPQDLVGFARLRNQAIATSGDYERFVMIAGRRYSHIMDPRTGYPVAGLASVSVVAPSGLDTDLLSTSIFVNGARDLDRWRERYPGLHVLVVRADAGGRLTTEPHGDAWEDLGIE